jgi:mono/diheme cytochrome c family protein
MSEPEDTFREPILEDAPLRRSLRRWQTVGSLFLFVLVLAFPLYKAVEGPRRADALASQQRALVSTGQQLWGLNCASCHGMNGQGVSAPALNSQQFLTSVADDQIHGIVAGGIPGTAMPAWWNEFGGALTDQQIAAVVAFLRSWEKDAPSVPNWHDVGQTGP